MAPVINKIAIFFVYRISILSKFSTFPQFNQSYNSYSFHNTNGLHRLYNTVYKDNGWPRAEDKRRLRSVIKVSSRIKFVLLLIYVFFDLFANL